MAGAIGARPGDVCRRGRWVALDLRCGRDGLCLAVRPAAASSTRSEPAMGRHTRRCRTFRPRRRASSEARPIRTRRCSCARTNCNTTTPTTASSRSATSRSTTRAPRSRPTGSSTSRPPSACAPKAMRASPKPTARSFIGEIIDLTDQFRDGFVDSLQLETADKTRFAAPRAERTGGRYTMFQSGVYTACEPCKDDPSKPPRWQVRATRIIHDDTEKMIYFEDARLEASRRSRCSTGRIFRRPIPTVKRKTGVLIPKFGYTSVMGASAHGPVLLGARAELRPHADADAHRRSRAC